MDWSKILGNPPTGTAVASSAAVVASEAPSSAGPAETATATASSGSTAETASSSGSSSSSSSAGFGGVTAPIASGNVDTYIGNIGAPCGSNMITIAEEEAASYQWVNKITNKGSGSCTWIQWNKAGCDGQANSGQFSAPILTTTIEVGETAYVAHDTNTQGAGCCWDGTTTAYGAKNCLYLEFDFDNQSNGGWSGGDWSAIQGGAASTGNTVTADGQESQAGNSANSYQSDSQAGGLGLNLPPGPVTMITTLND